MAVLLVKSRLATGAWTNSTQSILIPDDSLDLQLCLCLIVNPGLSDRRGIESTSSVLSQHFHWVVLRADVDIFIDAFIHFISTTRGENLQLIFDRVFHETKSKDLFQSDCVEISSGQFSDRYVLMLFDVRSDHQWFFFLPHTSTTSNTRANIYCCAAFGTPNSFMPSCRTHFKN